VFCLSLEGKKCIPCEGGVEPMSVKKAEELLQEIPGWKLTDKKLERKYSFSDFKEAMNFVNKVAEIAEKEGHHPDISIQWNKVILELWTHAIDGLSENDFIIASKVNKLI